MSELEIEIALAEIFDEESKYQDFINHCEAMEAEYGDIDFPDF